MDDSPLRIDGHAASERPVDLRIGARRVAGELRQTIAAWRLPSTWRATTNLPLWLAAAIARALVALAGLTGALAGRVVSTAERTEAAGGAAAGALAEVDSLDRRRIARVSGIRVAPLIGSGDAAHRTPAARWRLPADALVRVIAAGAATAAAVSWWWGTILTLELAVRRLRWGFSSLSYGNYPRRVHVLGVLLKPDHLTMPGAIALAALGLLGVLLWPAVPRAASVLDVALARSLADWVSGRSTRELEREVGRLSETRAQAVTAADAERRRIERDLHDGFQPQLVNLALNLGLARTRLASDPDGARALLERAHDDAKRATEDLRNIVRGIHPSVLDERGLDAAFSALAAESRVRLQIDVHLDRRPPREVEAVAYFVVAETVTNVNKHAGARTATVTVSEIGGALRVIVHDDGRGGARSEPGGGLIGLADRLAGVDGTFSVTSPAGGPTWIEARIPCGR